MFALISPVPVFAATNNSSACGLLPCNIYDNSAFPINENLNLKVSDLIKVGLGAVFVLILIYGIFLIIKAALTIIRSEGDEAKIQEGSGAVRAVFLGIGIIFIGIIGLVILIAFFGASNLTNQELNAPGNVQIPLITN